MSSEKRTIKINPELFKVSDKNTSRKKKPVSDTRIKVRSDVRPVRNRTLRNGVLRMLRENIREKQKQEYKNLINADKNTDKSNSKKSNKETEFKTDFEKSLQYFNNLNEKEAVENSLNQKQKHNTTFKREHNENEFNNNIQIKSFDENSISTALPDIFNSITPIVNNEIIPLTLNTVPKQLPPPPKYGCLRGGSLPTFRNWKQTTQRNYGHIPTVYTEKQREPETESVEQSVKIPEKPKEKQTILSEVKKKLIEKRQKFIKKDTNQKKDKPRLKYLKQRKTFKRSYHVGRSKIAPKIGVLISNKTVRQRISTSALHLKQTPMPDVKKFLVKKGFIKVGSIAPNDVLRQMYECAHLMCGEIENHNPENLLFNYFNDKE